MYVAGACNKTILTRQHNTTLLLCVCLQVWSELDPHASHFIPAIQLSTLIEELQPPLGVKGELGARAKIQGIIMNVHIPIREGKVRFCGGTCSGCTAANLFQKDACSWVASIVVELTCCVASGFHLGGVAGFKANLCVAGALRGTAAQCVCLQACCYSSQRHCLRCLTPSVLSLTWLLLCCRMQIHFLETMHALAGRIAGAEVPEDEELKVRRMLYPLLPCKDASDVPKYGVSHFYAALFVQAAVRGFLRRHALKEGCSTHASTSNAGSMNGRQPFRRLSKLQAPLQWLRHSLEGAAAQQQQQQEPQIQQQ